MCSYLKIRFVFIFILLTTICEDCFCDCKNQMLTKVVSELCVNIPYGTYTLSIVQTEFAHNDSLGRSWRNEATFGSVTRYYNHLDNGCDDKVDNRILDYYCLFDTVAIASRNAMATRKYPFETEQSISGYVKSTFKKVDNFVLKVFTPSTGDIQDLDIPGNKFILKGLDFCEGTVFSLQATRNNGSDRFLQLYIETPKYPNISVKKHHIPFINLRQVETVKQYYPNSSTVRKYPETVELPEIIAKGRLVKPMNRMKFDPDRAIGENDPLLEIAPTIESLVYRFGLSRGQGFITNGDDNDELILVEALGRISFGKFVPCEVMIDDDLVSGYALSDILNINPSDIKQLEYFLPSNYEMFGNLAGIGGSKPIRGLYGEASKRGLLMIWMKSPTALSRLKHSRPLSLVMVKQLGYMMQNMFDVNNVMSFNPTKYWNPYFNPQNFDYNSLKNIKLNSSKNYTIKIEGFSDEGVSICKQIIVRL